MLMEIRTYLEDRRSVSLTDLANRFRIAPEAIRGMLEHWIRKGKVVRHEFAGGCSGCGTSGGCGTCDTAAAFEIYEWVGPRRA